ncbi:uncharacterized protein TNCV_977401 [Trichonephila clavipes]|nr:uncharacterized protein TNCV_977401 [Trichonephila clavipes]
MKTVTYGTVSAPFLATRTLLQLLRDEEKNFPLAAPVLRENFYMDDVLCGAASLMESKALKNQKKRKDEMMKRVETALQMKTTPVYLWSDLTIVLAWIQKEPITCLKPSWQIELPQSNT